MKPYRHSNQASIGYQGSLTYQPTKPLLDTKEDSIGYQLSLKIGSSGIWSDDSQLSHVKDLQQSCVFIEQITIFALTTPY